MSKELVVRFDSVSFSYGDVQVIEKASFHIHKGEFVSMVGPNGSGKTTVIKLLFGLETPGSGSIEIFGNTYTDKKRNVMQNANLAYVPQMPPADKKFPITARDIVRMGLLRPLKGYSSVNAAVDEAMERAGIAELSGKQYGSLSGGQKRRALVARALAANPQFLVLDEPTANMDSDSETRLYETLAFYKGKTTILIVTHDTEFVSSLTDRVLCLGDGSRSIVQHRVDYNDHNISHEGSEKRYDARVLHSENLPEDGCCG
jgi:zinc transport system ATP-binding protein